MTSSGKSTAIHWGGSIKWKEMDIYPSCVHIADNSIEYLVEDGNKNHWYKTRGRLAEQDRFSGRNGFYRNSDHDDDCDDMACTAM